MENFVVVDKNNKIVIMLTGDEILEKDGFRLLYEKQHGNIVEDCGVLYVTEQKIEIN